MGASGGTHSDGGAPNGGSFQAGGASHIGDGGGAGNGDGGASPQGGAPGHGSDAGSGDSGGAVPTGPLPKLPAVMGACPDIKTGTVMVLGKPVQLWVGAKQPGKKGPLMFYWHNSINGADQAVTALGPVLDEIQAAGGVVASFSTTLGTGTFTATGYWYGDDFQMADVIVACAAAQLDIDTRRVYTDGCSEGGMQAGAMVFARSSYLAGAMPDSGGVLPFPNITDFEDPAHVPSIMVAYSYDSPNALSFEDTSNKACQAVKDAGGLAVSCQFNAEHCNRPPEFLAAQWRFMQDHPFDTKTDPYGGTLPASFPAACKAF